MNKELVQKWIDALRSGQYSQGIGKLKRSSNGETNYCCLGVACAVHPKVKETYTKFVIFKEREYEEVEIGIGSDIIQNKEIEKDFGLNTELQCELTEMNDYDGKSFSEIADWIEVNILNG